MTKIQQQRAEQSRAEQSRAEQSRAEQRCSLNWNDLLHGFSVVIGVIILVLFFNNYTKTPAFSDNFLIAENLSLKAPDAVKVVRNTNWPNHSDNPECWLVMDPFLKDCDSEKVENGKYYLIGDGYDFWKIIDSASGNPLDLENTEFIDPNDLETVIYNYFV